MDKQYYIEIDGEIIAVTENVYRAFKRPVWAERKRKEVRKDKERSLERFLEYGFDIPSDKSVENEVMDKHQAEQLDNAISMLNEDEHFLINELYFKNKSERQLAAETCVPRKTIAYRKDKILIKLKKIIEN